jgi:alkanesulfonate monooxygenase SsuD/methylene tetrahydromethanopterin reductase-like flavin-dependent oxidoreductase (luciferase family)
MNTGPQARRAMYGEHRLKLGLFTANATSSLTVLPERWPATWDGNVALARMADEAGLDFLLPIARWRGAGANSQRSTFETLTWATGLLALTKRITVFATIHVPLVNPVAAAKALVTADHVGGGRVGLNIVVGWNEAEFGMFGVEQRPGERRYPYAQEWIDVVKRIWNVEGTFDFDGAFFHLRGVEGSPKLLGADAPLLINAGRSPEGRQYAIHNCDAFFTSTGQTTFADVAAKVRAFQDEARASGRDLDVYSDGICVCRPTQHEAAEYFRHAVLENADWALIGRRLARRGNDRNDAANELPAPEPSAAERERVVHGAIGRDLVGDPDGVAHQLAAMAAAGIRGMALNFVNHLAELPYFLAEVLPRLERLGLRTAHATARERR